MVWCCTSLACFGEWCASTLRVVSNWVLVVLGGAWVCSARVVLDFLMISLVFLFWGCGLTLRFAW